MKYLLSLVMLLLGSGFVFGTNTRCPQTPYLLTQNTDCTQLNNKKFYTIENNQVMFGDTED